MAERPVYHCMEKAPFYEVLNTEFKFYSGFSIQQKQKSIESLHGQYGKTYADRKILEISSKSKSVLGVRLSAFNLMFSYRGKQLSVESAFQGSKVFEGNIQYSELYHRTSIEAKKDERIRNSGKIICFRLFGEDFPTEPVNYFYNWLYMKAIMDHPDYLQELVKYDSFTDIEFNPKKSWNCQAMAVAVCVGLYKANQLKEAAKDKDAYLNIVYGKKKKENEQMSIEDFLN
jgi:type I restriction enzyme M protein